mmetsp:Transcript_12426/g.35336  ORF Transcript_12426/g.35336 Transcript_12426/m.35336 type:complete len:176 (-) Transcript_12426:2140-2667(-)
MIMLIANYSTDVLSICRRNNNNNKTTEDTTMKAIAAFLLLVASAQNVLAFITPVSVTGTQPLFADPSTKASFELGEGVVNSPIQRLSASSLAGMITGITGFVGKVLAEEEYEIAELPPPYVPALFGVLLLVGVGVLTTSLGNVMDEEASLGMQSGARAKKEIERSRSSYFGKRPK